MNDSKPLLDTNDETAGLLEIRCDGLMPNGNGVSVKLNGVEISSILQGLQLNMQVGQTNQAVLTMAPQRIIFNGAVLAEGENPPVQIVDALGQRPVSLEDDE